MLGTEHFLCFSDKLFNKASEWASTDLSNLQANFLLCVIDEPPSVAAVKTLQKSAVIEIIDEMAAGGWEVQLRNSSVDSVWSIVHLTGLGPAEVRPRWLIASLQPETSYSVRVRRIDEEGPASSFSQPVNFTTLPGGKGNQVLFTL